MATLTQKQAELLEYIRAYIDEWGYAPTVREIAGNFGISIHAAHERLLALEAKGAVWRTPGIARGLTIRT